VEIEYTSKKNVGSLLDTPLSTLGPKDSLKGGLIKKMEVIRAGLLREEIRGNEGCSTAES